jgi:hypothetical protein
MLPRKMKTIGHLKVRIGISENNYNKVLFVLKLDLIPFFTDQGDVVSPMVSVSHHQRSRPEVEDDMMTPSSKAGGSRDPMVGFTPHTHTGRSSSPRQLFDSAPESVSSGDITDATDDIIDEVDSAYDPEISKVIMKVGSSG